MSVTVGSARSSFGNTTAGDQNGGQEVSTQSYYVHSKGWRVFRAIDPYKRALIADAMKKACKNNDIGYSQGTRNTLYNNVKDKGFDPSKTTKPVNTDCSALVRVCCNYAGIKVGDFITSSEPNALLKTGEFRELTAEKYTKKSDYLCAGDILVTKTKGHTIVILSNGDKYVPDAVIDIPVVHEFGSRNLENGCEGEDVKELQSYLIQLNYSCGSWGADGEFGDATEYAVRKFQSEHALVVDGVVGPKTIAMIMDMLSDEPETNTMVQILGGNCYVRTAPNTSAEKIGVAREFVTFLYANETSTDGWLKIIYHGVEGWVSGKYGKRD